jgi:hypothetical protein
LRPVLFEIKQGENGLSSHGGLALIGQLLQGTQLEERVDRVSVPNHPRPLISHSDVVKATIGLLCLGKPDFEAIEEFRDDRFFAQALGLSSVPSEGTLRQRLDDARGAFDTILLEESARLVKRYAPTLTSCYKKWIPLDVDVSPFDNSGTKKEGVSYTYKKVNGYAPIFAYLGGEGYWVHGELREGKQHCQEGTAAFLRESLRLSKQITAAPLLVRMDSGNDSADNIQVCQAEGVDWLIKRNLRQESVDDWLEKAKTYGEAEHPRPGKTLYRGYVHVKRSGLTGYQRIVFEVIERTCAASGEAFLFPEIEVDTYWTSLEASPEEAIDLYHHHGTSEQFHSEIKSDLNLERLPSGKMATNALILRLGMLAYNGLRLCGQELLRNDGDARPGESLPIRKKIQRRRLRSVMQDLMYLACRVVHHARRKWLSFDRKNPWYGGWRRIYYQFAGG